jgi:hypothetical protein
MFDRTAPPDDGTVSNTGREVPGFDPAEPRGRVRHLVIFPALLVGAFLPTTGGGGATSGRSAP